jgi:DNA repair exonuclease SbcCD ATPase subunit
MTSFDAYYYANCCGRPYGRDEHWLQFFGAIAARIVADIAPRTVIDAGCAMGLLVEALRQQGVEAWGIDISPYAIERVHDSVKPFCRQGSIAEPFERRADLIVCIEVVEHMPENEPDAAIDNMCAHADDILFSSSPNDHREPTHVSVRPAEDWAERFARHGFFRDTEFDATFIAPWAVRFRRSSEPVHRLIRGFERRLARLEQERGEMRAFTAEAQAKQAQAEAALAHTSAVLNGEIEALRRTVQPLHAEVATLRQSLAGAQAELAATRQALESAQAEARAHRETIGNMQKSLFWKMRRLFRR